MGNQNNQKVNENKNEQVTAEQPPVQNAPATEPAPVEQQQPAKAEQKEGFGGWLKKHWKGVTATAIAVGTAVSSGIVAYKKGKAAGMNATAGPVEEPEDYSLNPNE